MHRRERDALRALMFGAVLLVAGLGACSLALAAADRPLDAVALVAGVALALAYHASVKLVPGPDSHRSSLDELATAAILVLAPSVLPWAALVGTLLMAAATPVLGVQDRIRRAGTAKIVFNSGSLLTGTIAAYAVARFADLLGAPDAVGALAAGLALTWVQASLLIAVVSFSRGRERLTPVATAVRADLPVNVLTVAAGVVLGVVMRAVGLDVSSLAVLLAVLYAWARLSVRSRGSEHARARARSQLPTHVLAAELEGHVERAAAELVGARVARIRSDPPGPTEVGALIDEDPARWLVASEPTSVVGRFSTDDEDLLRGLAQVAAPASRHADVLASSVSRHVSSGVDGSAASGPLSLDAIERHGRLLRLVVEGDEGRRGDRCDLARVLESVRSRVPHVVSVAPGPSVTVAGTAQLVATIIESAIHDIVLGHVEHPVVWWRHEHRHVVVAIEDADHPLDRLEVVEHPPSTDEYAARLVRRAVQQLGGRAVLHRRGPRTVALDLHIPLAG